MLFLAFIDSRSNRLVVRNLDYIESIEFDWPDLEELTATEFRQACWDLLLTTLQSLVDRSEDPIEHILFVGATVNGHIFRHQWFTVDPHSEQVDKIESSALPLVLDFGTDFYLH